MATLDIVVIAVIVLSGLIAFGLGLVRVVLGLAGWLGAAVITLYGFEHVRPLTRQWIANPLIADVAAIGGLFIIALIILSLISHAISRVVRNSALNVLDRSLGLAFGLALGVLLICGAWLVAVPTLDIPAEASKRPQWVREAQTMPLIEAGAERLRALAPARLRDVGRKETRTDAPPRDAGEEASREVRTLIEVAPKAGAPAEKRGYDSRERNEMDRLLRGQQEQTR
ncbi:MAG: CvpA family protein [Alphaproteobacteria bacterium]|nr:CvpA family protein [Alphaproteobacteria bacterium]